MGIIAWIVLGLGAGVVAHSLMPGRGLRRLVISSLIGIAGALFGGLLAVELFDVSMQGFFNPAAWITATAGASVQLTVYHLIIGQVSGRRPGVLAGRRRANAGRR